MSRRNRKKKKDQPEVEVETEDQNEADNHDEAEPEEDDDSVSYKCQVPMCKRTFKYKNNRCRHEKVCKFGKKPEKEKPSLICPHCKKVFPRKFNLDRHVASGKCYQKHDNTKIFSCSICSKGFATKYRRDRHRETHSKEEFSCDNCSAKYVRFDKFEKHKCKTNIPPTTSLVDDTALNDLTQEEYSMVDIHDYSTSAYSFTSVNRFNSDISQTEEGCSTPMNESLGNEEENFYNFQMLQESAVYEPAAENGSLVSLEPTNACSTSNDLSDLSDEEPVVYVQTAESEVEDMDAALFHIQVSMAIIKKLKYLKQRSIYSSLKRGQFTTLFLQLFDGYVADHDIFMRTLAAELSFDSLDDMLDFINTDHQVVKPKGRPPVSKVHRQMMYDHWKSVSELSNDRRNARHMIKIKRKKLSNYIADLVDDNISETTSKRGPRLKAQKRIYSGEVRSLYASFAKIHPEVKSSVTTFYRCRPYYISPATDREMEGCMCAKCLNPHELYKVVRKHIDDLPHSLTDYLTDLFSCSLDHDINFHHIDCIEGTCKNSCHIHDDSGKDLGINWDELVPYSQYEKVEERFFDKSGVEKKYTRTSRKDYTGEHRKKLKEVYSMLMDCAPKYLEHRYYVVCDRVYWSKFKSETNNPILWLDYSQNIKITPKTDVQASYYSGKQQTLHDGLIQMPNGDLKYIFHLSDDTSHDSVMIDQIIRDILKSYPELIRNGILILRSDNCSPQYKCKFVFANLLKVAKEFNLKIYWFFGEPGHGRGLIDAMAWFGCKAPLRKAIIQNDKWFMDASAMIAYLQAVFENTNKYYHFINDVSNAEIRASGAREERPIPGCRAAHILSFHPDGSVRKVRFLKDMDSIFKENEMVDEEEEIVDDDGENEPFLVTPDDLSKYDLIEIGSFIAIKSTNMEMFHVYKVKKKGIAEHNIMDASGEHTVLKGEPYIVGTWISFLNENNKYARYKESCSSEDALIHVGEVFATDIQFDEKLQISIHDYRVLCCNM